MNYRINESETGGSIEALEGDVQAGRATYFTQNEGKTMVIDHTVVHENYQGKGIGSELLKQLIDLAKANDMNIKPECEYAVGFFEKHKLEYETILLK